ncbi:BQ2448_7771 [Microbotryum intermedium]|uniref:BQ2448_7771 protein n=1 Tax=Microbotryum intermedium TaxID=269621 RepID=A0A238FLV4_9BASI|nr:BQ2448_7771 [Microbotryum intermedium]
MGRTPPYHHIGTVLLLVAMVLMLIVCISAPLINNLYLLEATVAEGQPDAKSMIKAGIFGYCVGDSCTSPQISYDTALLSANGQTQIDEVFIPSLTYGLVLNPLSAGFTFLAFLFAFGGQSIWGSIATFFSLWSFILTVVALTIDFAAFGIASDRLNHSSTIEKGSVKFGRAMWLVVISVACQFLATLIVFCSRASVRRQKQKEKNDLPLTRQDTRRSESSESPLKSDKASALSSFSGGHFRRRSNPIDRH